MKEERRKKLENFWYYHKWHVIIGIVALFLIGYTIHEVVTKVNPDLTIDCIMDTGMDYEKIEILTNDLRDNGGITDNNGDGRIKVQIGHYQTGKDPSSASSQGSMSEVVQLRMAVGECSLLLTEPHILNLYAEQDLFEDLTAIADEMNIPEEKRYMSKDGNKVVAINIDDSEFFAKNNIITKDCYAAIRVLNHDQLGNKEKIKQNKNAGTVIKYIIKQ